MNNLVKLQNLGLKKQEAEVYLACLKLGAAKVSELASEVNIPRTSIYVHLKNLSEKGFVRKSRKENREYFFPIEPAEVADEAKEKMEEFLKIVPALEKLSDWPGKKPKIEYFDSAQGLFKLYEKMLKMDYAHLPYLIESGEAVQKIFEKVGWKFFYKWEKKFLEKGVVTQGLITEDVLPILKNAPEKLKATMRKRPATVKIIDNNSFPFKINLYLLYPAHIFIIAPQENFVLIIENKNIYLSLVTLYRCLYEKGRLFNVKDI